MVSPGPLGATGSNAPYRVAPTVATILLLPAWGAVSTLPPGEIVPGLLQLLVGTVVLAGLLAWTGRFDDRSDVFARAVRFTRGLLLFVLASDVVVWVIRTVVPTSVLDSAHTIPHWRPTSWLLWAGLFVIATRWRARAKLTRLASSVLWPLPIVLVLSLLWKLVPSVQPGAPSAAAPRRVVWLVFDELDLGYVEADLSRLQGFAELRSRAVWSSAAFSPASDTRNSTPMLWTGMRLSSVGTTSSGWLAAQVAPDGPYDEGLLQRENVFHALASGGARVQIVGWAFKYCGNIAMEQSVACQDDRGYRSPSRHLPLPIWLVSANALVRLGHEIALRASHPDTKHWYMWGQYYGPEGLMDRRMARYMDEIEANAAVLFGDSTRALSFGHLPCPHLPPFGLIDGVPVREPEEDYVTNLERCDRLLQRIVELVNRGSSRQSTMLIVSSDHWFRYHNTLNGGGQQVYGRVPRPVPFIVYLPSDSTGGGTVRVPFTTRPTRELVEEFLRGSVTTYADVRHIIDEWSRLPLDVSRARPADLR